MVRLLSISGSLRSGSSNTALLEAAAVLAPPGIAIDLYRGIGVLPHFNPDRDGDDLPPAVAAFRARVGRADGLLVACPEYARGIPGAFKNALDWLVGGAEFTNMPVALCNASPRASDAQRALRLVLETMSARLVAEADLTLPLLGKDYDAAGILGDMTMSETIRASLRAFGSAIERLGRDGV